MELTPEQKTEIRNRGLDARMVAEFPAFRRFIAAIEADLISRFRTLDRDAIEAIRNTHEDFLSLRLLQRKANEYAYDEAKLIERESEADQ